MEHQLLLNEIYRLYDSLHPNSILLDDPRCADTGPIKLFEAPLVAVGSADDTLFETFKQPGIIGPWYLTPTQWLPGAVSVISLFFPFSDQIKQIGRSYPDGPSPVWMLGRKNGQACLAEFVKNLIQWLEQQGCSACSPIIDGRFRQVIAGNNFSEFACADPQTFGSNWSERHAAFVCGLGTFGLSGALITEKGISGRLISVITDCSIPPTTRPYTDIYEYCTHCGACIKRCPSHAISHENGKNHTLCFSWLKSIAETFSPQHECGSCQSKVPCENINPKQIVQAAKIR